MTDLRETLDRAIPLVPEPSVPLPGAAERVHHGRRVLRRRRIVGEAGAVVVAAVVFAGAVAIVPIGPDNDRYSTRSARLRSRSRCGEPH